VWTELAHRTSAFAAKYDFWRGPENERQLDAARLLLTAIQAGRIRPIDENGRIVPRGKWAHATPGDWPDVRMLRDDILIEFPVQPSAPSGFAPSIGRTRGRKPKQFERVLAEMRQSLLAGENPSLWKEVEMEARFRASRDTCRRALAALSVEN
jgi:hypothetical protein